MKVVLTRDALADLNEIASWIGRDDLGRAERFVEALRRQCATLAHRPARYPVVYTQNAIELRKLAFRRYLIFYRMSTDQVDILRIVHGARDWASLFA